MAKQIRRRQSSNKFDKKGLMAIYLAFSHKFGRPPRGDDPVFFDPHAERPCSLPLGATQRLLLEAMLEIGTPPPVIYAFCVTGFHENRTELSPDRLQKWDRAISNFLAFGFKIKSVLH